MAKLVENPCRASWQMKVVLILRDIVRVVPGKLLHAGMMFSAQRWRRLAGLKGSARD